MAKHTIHIEVNDLAPEEAAELANELGGIVARNKPGRFHINLSGGPYVNIDLLRSRDRDGLIGWKSENRPFARSRNTK